MHAEAEPVEPWRSFLAELDGLLKGPVELRCLGGFVVTQQYGIGRETSDIDFLRVVAQSPEDNIETLAGLGTRPDPTDIALSKLERNAERDREDFLRLAQAGYIDRQVLKDRYREELRPYLLNKLSWHDKTLELWLEMAWPGP